ncbi:hypothetical protein GCM10007198_25400 [Microbacterium aerolatum]|uniref:Uncharacterized protein n=1 Tax=Microbacterium aerolatum TaxID=153731 RepID=A0A511AHR8_9MICO|nr:hypothetical protein MAE01_29060 [Microbacterium aerolatum]GGB33787.1 hypothetical protein GCM10007198_25400 [Microbacterium aerolatum]
MQRRRAREQGITERITNLPDAELIAALSISEKSDDVAHSALFIARCVEPCDQSGHVVCHPLCSGAVYSPQTYPGGGYICIESSAIRHGVLMSTALPLILDEVCTRNVVQIPPSNLPFAEANS